MYYLQVHSSSHALCADVDECMLELDDCDQDAECTNTIGNYTCACNTGFTGDGFSCSMLGFSYIESGKLEERICEGIRRGCRK